jgi:hypothetical protein
MNGVAQNPTSMHHLTTDYESEAANGRETREGVSINSETKTGTSARDWTNDYGRQVKTMLNKHDRMAADIKKKYTPVGIVKPQYKDAHQLGALGKESGYSDQIRAYLTQSIGQEHVALPPGRSPDPDWDSPNKPYSCAAGGPNCVSYANHMANNAVDRFG